MRLLWRALGPVERTAWAAAGPSGASPSSSQLVEERTRRMASSSASTSARGGSKGFSRQTPSPSRGKSVEERHSKRGTASNTPSASASKGKAFDGGFKKAQTAAETSASSSNVKGESVWRKESSNARSAIERLNGKSAKPSWEKAHKGLGNGKGKSIGGKLRTVEEHAEQSKVLQAELATAKRITAKMRSTEEKESRKKARASNRSNLRSRLEEAAERRLMGKDDDNWKWSESEKQEAEGQEEQAVEDDDVSDDSGFLGRLLRRERGHRGGSSDVAESLEGIYRNLEGEIEPVITPSSSNSSSSPSILSLDRINERPAYDASRDNPLSRLGHAVYRGEVSEALLNKDDDFGMIDTKEASRSLLMLRHDHPRKYVAVVVDADQLTFLPELLLAGAEGGKVAAEVIRRNVANDLDADPDEIDIRIDMFANNTGLRRFLNSQKTIPFAAFSDFLHGFINSSPFYRFVDTGPTLQSADNKVKAVFVDYVLDDDCEQVYIGGLGDYGYRAELDSLRRLQLLHRVSLLGIPEYTRVSRFYSDYAQRKVSWAGDIFVLVNWKPYNNKADAKESVDQNVDL